MRPLGSETDELLLSIHLLRKYYRTWYRLRASSGRSQTQTFEKSGVIIATLRRVLYFWSRKVVILQNALAPHVSRETHYAGPKKGAGNKTREVFAEKPNLRLPAGRARRDMQTFRFASGFRLLPRTGRMEPPAPKTAPTVK